MRPTDVNQVIEEIAANAVVSESVAEELRAAVGPADDSAEPPEIAEFLDRLVNQHVLTSFQSREVQEGRSSQLKLGKYRVIDMIGEGGMGRVLLAEQTSMRRIVALKVIENQGAANPQMISRFAQEAQAIAALKHPNIVQAHDFDEDQGRWFIVMEFIEGLSVFELVQAEGPRSPGQAADFVRQAAMGLQHAHDAGVIHRDIKPGNLIVQPDGVLRLLDLGLAAVSRASEDGNITADLDKPLLGTADYMAPEQAVHAVEVDHRADIYSLGCVLYFLLAGEPPFPYGFAAQKLLAHQMQQPKPIREHNPDVPEELAAVLERMMAKSLEDRFQSAAELVAAIEPLAEAKTPPFDEASLRFQQASIERSLDYKPSFELGSEVREISFKVTEAPTPKPVEAGSSSTPAYVPPTTEEPSSVSAEQSPDIESQAVDEPERGVESHGAQTRAAENTRSPVGWIAAAVVVLVGAGIWAFGSLPNDDDELSAKSESASAQHDKSTVDGMSSVTGKSDAALALKTESDDEITQPQTVTSKTPAAKTDTKPQPANKPKRLNALDKLAADAINEYEFVRALRDAGGQTPQGLVAIFGDSRLTHWHEVTDVVCTPDAATAITASLDGTIKFWDANNGSELKSLKTAGTTFSVLAISQDGKKLAAASVGGTLAMFDVTSGLEVWRKQHADEPFRSIAFVNDDAELWTVSDGAANLLVWEARNGEQSDEFAVNTKCAMMVVDPTESTLAIAHKNRKITLWDVQARNRIATLEAHERQISDLAFDRDGKHLVSCSHLDRQVHLWSLDSDVPVQSFNTRHQCSAVSFGLDTSQIVAGDGWSTRFHDTANPTPDAPQWINTNFENKKRFHLAPDRKTLFNVCEDHQVQMIDLRTQSRRFQDKPQSWAPVSLSISADATLLAAGDHNKLHIWDLPTQTHRTITDFLFAMHAMAVSPDGRMIAGTGAATLGISAWSTKDGERQFAHNLDRKVQSVAFSPESSRLALGLFKSTKPQEARSMLFDVVGAEPIADIEQSQEQWARKSVCFNSTGELVAVGGSTSVVVANGLTGQLHRLLKLDDEQPPNFQAVAFVGGSRVLAGSQSGKVILWDLDTESVIPIYSETLSIQAVAASPDGTQIAWTTANGKVSLRSVTGNDEPTRLRVGPHGALIRRIQFGPDGRHLITLNGNGTIYVLRLN